ncbi:MAG: archaeal proteasome endopeptidase complex subunit beta [Candidatus Micrarchaeota archaeon]|nr:archaeal proteasome endopeptidase complex subunit beta [Candidatus Micrarchaeota archaeon]
MENSKSIQTGTTTVAVVCSDGIVLASDKRATMGYFIASKDVTKIFPISDNIAMTVAGSVGDAQALVRLLQAEARLYKLRYSKEMSATSAATLLANILFQYKFFPYYVQLILAGKDEEKYKIFSIDAIGGVTEEKFTSSGSGSPIAYGVLEASYKENVTTKEMIQVAIKAVNIAMKRDSASGEAVDVVLINKNGIKRLEKSEINKWVE